ncbi:hypothetical protein SAMN05443144_111111 [Fodinibius roseus]|uniref:Fimbrial assembly protein (PilN) n=1 Tax=Fodinibius roseus TaxID=1194090 RepID=A0A1M5DGQ4_9BACT|nr:PilN domain-containing protein [Fodinibius roseus]SHF66140.1 hypothetical protein SAMN05443144_111111 [Fodinibius roseus]
MEKEFIGVTQDGDLLKIARIQKEKSGWRLTNLSRVAIKVEADVEQEKNRSKEMVDDHGGDFLFGIDESYDESLYSNDDGNEEDNFDLLRAIGEEGDSRDLFHSNVGTLRDELEEHYPKKLKAGITIQNGDTNFQVLKDKNYNQLKTRELQDHLAGHLEKVYGSVPGTDHYNYNIREDGSLLLISYQEKPYLLRLLDRARNLYSGKIKIQQMLPDEVLLAGLVKENYTPEENEISCVIHMGLDRSRLFFMRGGHIQYAVAPIEIGRETSSVLEVLFSKILFQLDTGELSGLDRILITNNDPGGAAISYFRRQFPDVMVDEFRFKAGTITIPKHLAGDSPSFTSAIGAALSAAETRNPNFSEYSMVPAYVRERQNMLKLRWHGMVLLIFLLVTPTIWNVMYQEKQDKIEEFNAELFRTELRILDLEPVVAKAGETRQLYELEQMKMELLNSLSDGAYYWSETLKTLNDGLGSIKNVWIERIKHVEDGFMLQGYSMTRGRIPQVTNLFDRADLKAVSVVEMRERKLYKFSIKGYNDTSADLDSKFERIPIDNDANTN